MDAGIVAALITSVASVAVSVGASVWTRQQGVDLERMRYEFERSARDTEKRSAAKAELDRYREPLLLAVVDLGARLHTIRDRSLTRYLTSTQPRGRLAVLGSLYCVARYFGTLEILYSRLALLRFDSAADTQLVAALLSDIGRAFASDSYDDDGVSGVSGGAAGSGGSGGDRETGGSHGADGDRDAGERLWPGGNGESAGDSRAGRGTGAGAAERGASILVDKAGPSRAPRFMLWQEEQRAIGELMRGPDRASTVCVGFAYFHEHYDETFARWLDPFAEALRAPDAAGSERLARLQTLLALLVTQLDEDGGYCLAVDGTTVAPQWATVAALT
ncbi:Secreted protein [Frankia sp. AiPs1]|uniref:hypothetical protein n=1 Tax=Frankia sp. AiPa1 TaxID=573492 RepID=UPI00202B3FA7|nr:hypothetical protein [Frankia sp. AiPa1]MCL9760972.1 hypothetical protein [Frankia sp. AiPa1]